MNTKIQLIITRMKAVNTGEPWYGRPVYSLLKDVTPSKVFIKPGNNGHSMAELLYHMITWAGFTLERIQSLPKDMAETEAMDWRGIDPEIHSWKKGLDTYNSVQNKIIEELSGKDDSFLSQKVDYREYDFEFLLNGMIEHGIYHSGQIAYIEKML